MPEQHPDTGKVADLAAFKYTGRPAVCLMFGERRKRPVGMGTGTLLRAASGTPVILSAGHVVEGHEGMSLCVVGPQVPEFYWAPSYELRLHPEYPDVDIGLVVIPGGEELKRACVGPDALATEATSKAEREGYSVVGFPDQLSIERMTTDGKKLDLFRGSIIYRTNLLGRDRRRLSLDFQRATAPLDGADMRAVGIDPGQVFELQKPNTLSGAAVWRIRPQDCLIWTPGGGARIVGVAVEFTKRRSELAEPIERWGDWVREQLASL
jgi:hypothetical protein